MNDAPRRVERDPRHATLGSRGLATDVCVPLGALAASVVHAKGPPADCPVPHAIMGPVGDGNVPVVLAMDPEGGTDAAIVARVDAAMVQGALSPDGTCTGEHGVGLGKRACLHAEHGPALAVMARPKAAPDPDDPFNPGKILPEMRCRTGRLPVPRQERQAVLTPEQSTSGRTGGLTDHPRLQRDPVAFGLAVGRLGAGSHAFQRAVIQSGRDGDAGAGCRIPDIPGPGPGPGTGTPAPRPAGHHPAARPKRPDRRQASHRTDSPALRRATPLRDGRPPA